MNSNNTQDTNVVILANSLVKKYADFSAVKGVNFVVSRGECFGLLGPNGAGKTSIVQMIYGFSPVTSGQLMVFEQNIMEKARIIKTKIGVVAQEDNLDPELTVLDNLLVYAGYFRMKKNLAKTRAVEILDFMDLKTKSTAIVEQLSGGMKRRLTIGRALLNQPELLILDEPTTGLDPYARQLVWQRLRKLKEAGTTILLTTHYLEEARQLCDRLIFLHRGEILEEGTPESLIESHVGKDALELGIESGKAEDLLGDNQELVKAQLTLDNNLILFSNHGQKLADLLTEKASSKGISLNYHRLRSTNLEDVYLKLTGATLQEDNDTTRES